jgi:acetyl esterase
MPVLAPLKPLFEGMLARSGQVDPRPPAQARAAMHAMIDQSFGAFHTPAPPLPSEVDHRVAVAGGEITVRVYDDGSGRPGRPCHLYLHGGGFWLGTLEHSDNICRAIAALADCVVASVDYRLAPEHKFPTAAEDCWAALRWVAAEAESLGVDMSRISVGGGSAGGNLSAVVSLMARDRGGPRPVLQVLEIPVTDMTRMEPLRLPHEDLEIPIGKAPYAAHYLAAPEDGRNPYASPLLAPDLGGLPPAFIVTAEYDPLRPEGDAYAQALSEAGVAVEHHVLEGQFHGSHSLATLIPEEAAAYRTLLVSALRRAFNPVA